MTGNITRLVSFLFAGVVLVISISGSQPEGLHEFESRIPLKE